MDEIIKSLDNIADAINGDALTTCLSIIFAVVPIVLVMEFWKCLKIHRYI